jgi:MFS family permease
MSDDPTTLFCYNHPQVETGLRCKNCDKPICAKCAVLTPTGYRCQSCVRKQQKLFDTAHWYDYPLVFAVVLILSFLGSVITSFIATSFLGFFTIILAPAAGGVIAEIVRRLINRRRSKRLFQLAAIAAALGSIPLLLISGLRLLGGINSLWALLPLVWQALYTFMVTSTVLYRLRGIKL